MQLNAFLKYKEVKEREAEIKKLREEIEDLRANTNAQEKRL